MANIPRSTLTAYVAFKDAVKAIDFYKSAFGAEEPGPRIVMPDGGIGHAELRFGNATLMLSTESPEYGAISVETYGGSPISLSLMVEDCNAATERARKAGAIVDREPEDQFYGDRTSWIRDPFGLRWSLHTQIEDISGEEMVRRAENLFGKPQ